MNKQYHRIVFFTFIVVVCTMMLSVQTVFALDTYSMTVTTDYSSYVQGAIITISGVVTNTNTSMPESSVYVGIKVFDPQGNLAYSTIALTNVNGSYSTYFSDQLGATQPPGNYTVMVNAAVNGTQIASKTANYLVTLAPTPTPTPTPSPTPTLAPTPTPTPTPTINPTPLPTATLPPNPTPTSTPKPMISPTASPTANPTTTSTPQPTPTPTIPEFPLNIVALLVILAASAAVVLGIMKRSKSSSAPF